MDRYFTTVRGIDELHAKGLHATGTLHKHKIPRDCDLVSDAELRRQPRGTYNQYVRKDGQVAIVKWLDSRPVFLASNVHGGKPEQEVTRWCKKTKRYIDIQRPQVISQYNINMGGIDVLDKMIAYYRISARTKKWL